MPLREELASGAAYLDLVTRLLQRMRVADPTSGLWEAADLQWWWRRDRPSDRGGQVFWLDDRRDPVAAVIFTDWARIWVCDVLVAPDTEAVFGTVWQRALDRMAALGLETVEVAARDDDTTMLAALAAAGFSPTGEAGAATWLDAVARPTVAPLRIGFRLRSRADTADRQHHMTSERNGDHVAERLAECSLYQPALDLLVEAPNGHLAAAGLFWPDPVTGVGLVEPMRTEMPYRRLGLARHLLTAGLDLLAAHGCARLKVSYEADNPAARDLYLGAGFTPESTTQTYRNRN